MFPSRRLKDLARHKRLLILHADLQRTVLRAEYAAARSRLGALTDGAHGSVGRWLSLAVKIIGIATKVRQGRLATWVSFAILVWRWTRRAKAK